MFEKFEPNQYYLFICGPGSRYPGAMHIVCFRPPRYVYWSNDGEGSSNPVEGTFSEFAGPAMILWAKREDRTWVTLTQEKGEMLVSLWISGGLR